MLLLGAIKLFMSTVTLEIPEQFAASFGDTPEEIARNAKTELAIEMYREAKWSTGKAAEFCGMLRIEFMDLLRDRKVPMPYTNEAIEQDIAYARRRVG
jgi:predicted HTH domain antitoxin